MSALALLCVKLVFDTEILWPCDFVIYYLSFCFLQLVMKLWLLCVMCQEMLFCIHVRTSAHSCLFLYPCRICAMGALCVHSVCPVPMSDCPRRAVRVGKSVPVPMWTCQQLVESVPIQKDKQSAG